MSHWPQLLPPCLGSPSLRLGGSMPLPCMSSCGRLSGGGALGSPALATPLPGHTSCFVRRTGGDLEGGDQGESCQQTLSHREEQASGAGREEGEDG